MHFDALTLACITAELNRTVCPGRIQQVLLVDDHTLGFEVYTPGTRHQLLIALPANAARIHIVEYKLRRGVERETPLLLLLRKYARGALLAACVQPDPTERLLQLQLEHPELGRSTLLVELIGRQPNALLLNPAGRILECLHRQSGTPGERMLLPGQLYVAPAAQAKLPPLDNGDEGYYAQLAEIVALPGPLWKALVAGVAGISPTAAREIAWRAQSARDAGNTAGALLAVTQALQELWAPVQSGAWQPGLIEEEGAIVGFAAYPVHFRGHFTMQPSLSAALARSFAAGAVARPADPYAAPRGQVLAQVRRAAAQVTRRLEALAGDEPAPGEADSLRTQAHWLLALASQVGPEQSVLEVDTGSEPLQIRLEPHLSPIEQAQRMYKRAAKLERAAQVIPQRRAELLAARALLEQLTLDAQRAANQPELAAVRDELQRAGLVRADPQRTRRPGAPAEGGPLRYRTARGAEIVVGRNARQNELVTFKLAHAEDLWLHVRGAPGAHVIIRASVLTPDDRDIETAAQLAAFHSSLRGERRVDVIVTLRRWVSRAPGGHIGQVVVTREQVIGAPATEPAGLTLKTDQKP